MNDTTRLPTTPDRRSNRGKVESTTAERVCMGCGKGVCGNGPVPAGGPSGAAQAGNVTQTEILKRVRHHAWIVAVYGGRCTEVEDSYAAIEAALTAAGVPK